jgi:hypothetical protein
MSVATFSHSSSEIVAAAQAKRIREAGTKTLSSGGPPVAVALRFELNPAKPNWVRRNPKRLEQQTGYPEGG